MVTFESSIVIIMVTFEVSMVTRISMALFGHFCDFNGHFEVTIVIIAVTFEVIMVIVAVTFEILMAITSESSLLGIFCNQRNQNRYS